MKKIATVLIILVCFLSFAYAEGEIISNETYASYYAEAFNGKPTASGEIFDMNAYTAAHRTLPFGTMVEVTNLENGKKVIVRINDRGPFVGNRDIDISKAAAAALDMLSRGVTRVSLRKIDPNDRSTFGVNTQPQDQTYQNTQVQNSQFQEQYPNMQQYQGSQYQNQNAQMQGQQYQNVQPQTPYQQDGQYQNTQAQQTQSTQYQYQNIQPQENRHIQEQPYVSQHEQPQKELVYIPTTPEQTSGELWRIQLGSFVREENAMRLVIQLRKIGFEPAYEKTETHIRVVLYGIRPFDLEKVKDVLRKNNFKDYILKQENW